MAKFPKLATDRFGTPPAPEETVGNLAAPEVAPSAAQRTRRKTGRTVLFSTRVSEQFDREFRAIADREHVLLTKLLELALEAYKDSKR
jgi:hypothetical protein